MYIDTKLNTFISECLSNRLIPLSLKHTQNLQTRFEMCSRIDLKYTFFNTTYVDIEFAISEFCLFLLLTLLKICQK